MLDLSSLNNAQLEAVQTLDGPLLVLAGAGSGKTRVLTYRIANILDKEKAQPYQILAVTFTNKAATEMRERLEKLLAVDMKNMWVKTFHRMCARILGQYGSELGYTSGYTIYDALDTKNLIKNIMADLSYDTKVYPDNVVRNRISTMKNALVTPEMASSATKDAMDKCVAAVYSAMQARLKRANAMDFDDLLLNTHLLFEKNPEIAQQLGRRFRYILVDEFQDTNHAQYAIIKKLAMCSGNLMVVGDDDQSIYSWRGADVRNILEFEHDWPDATEVKLEQNYRSTGNILAAANAVIMHNDVRKDKHLFTESGDGEKIAVYMAADERDEGRWIASEIEKLHDAGVSYEDVAVFYRTNAFSRTLEDMFNRAGVFYRIVGGTRFYDRMEIRDVAAFLKLVANPSDDVSARRIINVPRRGIGKTTIDKISSLAQVREMTFMQAAEEFSLDPSTRAATRTALRDFLAIIEEGRQCSGRLFDVVDIIIARTQLIEALKAQHTEEADGRIENIHEFMTVVRDFEDSHVFYEEVEDENGDLIETDTVRMATLSDFIERLSLRSDLDSMENEGEEMATLMTIHSAKGLEFDYVFVAGLEEFLFPHSNSIMERGVDEERRLAYVAITRARKKLFLTHAQTRKSYQGTQANPRSRFINEIPEELIDHEGIGSRGLSGTGWEKRGDRRGTFGSGRGEDMYGGHVYGSRTASAATKKAEASSDEFKVGDHIDHKIFGAGEVLEVDGDKLVIHFGKMNKTKKLLLGYAPIVKINK